MTPGTDLAALADEALAWIVRRAPGLEAELYLSRSRDRGIELKEGRVDAVQESSEEGIGLRLLDGPRMGFASAGGLGLDALPELLGRARDQIRFLPHDEARVLPEAERESGDRRLAESVWDDGLFRKPLEDLLPAVADLEARALAADPRVAKVVHSGYGEGQSTVAIVSTAGVRACESGTSVSVGLSLAAKDGAQVQVGSASSCARRACELDWGALARDAAFRTTALVGARKLPSKRRAVLFDPWVAGELLEMLAGALSADAVQRGRSLLKGRLGERVAAPCVSFRDDPRLPGGLSSSLFDDEGVPTRTKAMVDGGVLKDFFHDAYTARREGSRSNGCAGRGGYKGMPGPGPSNFFLVPGESAREALIAGTQDGILVLEIMGMHTADPVSGEFSVGVSGVAVQGGELGHGIRGAMISANLLDLLARVDGVASDLRFYGSIASPTFRVAGLTVA